MKTKTRRATPKTNRLDLTATLAQLESAQLVRRVGEEQATYMFKHALTQDAAYQSLLHAQRKDIHRCVAQAYEAQYGDQCLDDYAGILANHYAQAGDDEQVIVYARHAGDLAANKYAYAEAIAFYSQALGAAKRIGAKTEQFVYLYTKRGRALEISGDIDRALSEYIEMADFARTRFDRALELAALGLRAVLHSTPTKLFNPEIGHQLLDQALALAKELNDRVAEIKILWNFEVLSLHTSQSQQALDYGEKALAIASELTADGRDVREQTAFILHDLMVPSLLFRGRARAREVNEQARVLWRELDNKPMLADNLANMAQHLVGYGEFERAIEYAIEALEISQSIGNEFGVIFSKSFLAGANLELGDVGAAWRAGLDILDIGKDLGAMNRIIAPANLALLAAMYGGDELSKEYDRRTRAGFTDNIPVFFRYIAFATLADADVLRGELTLATDDLASSGSKTMTESRALAWAVGAIAETRLALQQHDLARAISTADPILQHLIESGMKWWLPELNYLRGLALAQQGNADAAYQAIDQARLIAEEIHQRRMLWQIYAMLSEMETARGNLDQASTYEKQARQALEFIVAHLPQEFHESFLNLPQVRGVMETE